MTGSALAVRDLRAGYGKVRVLHGLSLDVPEGYTVALLGANGAGKTTTLGALTGSVKTTGGDVRLYGQSVTRLSTYQRAQRGLTLIPDGRGVFTGLTVTENLQIAADAASGVDRSWKTKQLARVLEIFPRLGERSKQRAGTMSGGEQQMLAMSRAFLSNPRVLLMDEISMGLAPQVVALLYDAVAELASTRMTIVLVEQYLTYALKMADICYVLAKGEISFVGDAAELRHDPSLMSYL